MSAYFLKHHRNSHILRGIMKNDVLGEIPTINKQSNSDVNSDAIKRYLFLLKNQANSGTIK